MGKEASFRIVQGSICVNAVTYHVEADSVMAGLDFYVYLSDGPHDDESLSSSGAETEDEPIVAIIKGIAIKLRGSCVEGEDWFYDARHDIYLTGAILPDFTPDEAILVAEEFLIDGYTLDTEPFYSEEYGDYETYFSYDNGRIYVDALAYVDEADSSCSDLEFWAYVPEDE